MLEDNNNFNIQEDYFEHPDIPLGTEMFPNIVNFDIIDNPFNYDSIDLNESNPNNSFRIIDDEEKNSISGNEIKENKENNNIIVNEAEKLSKTLNHKSTQDYTIVNDVIEKKKNWEGKEKMKNIMIVQYFILKKVMII